MELVLIIGAGALVAGFVSGLAGFGTGLVALGFWLHAVVAWDAIQTIAVHTKDGGPYLPDFWWVLEAGVPHWTWPQGATGEEEARDHLFKRYPDVNNETLLFAYGSTENARFVCWKQ